MMVNRDVAVSVLESVVEAVQTACRGVHVTQSMLTGLSIPF